MDALHPDVMRRQVEALGDDLRALTAPVAGRLPDRLDPVACRELREVILVGSGDSHHAALATRAAFADRAGLACTPMSTLPFLAYGVRAGLDRGTLVVGISASGNTPLVVRALDEARAAGARTLAITGTPDSGVTRSADDALVVQPGSRERSPGIRTYQASLLGLLLVAGHLAEARRSAGPVAGELAALGDLIDRSLAGWRAGAVEASAWCADSPATVVLGCGPGYGTALYVAAKLVEAAGVPAYGQDVEEWCHVERFAHPPDLPVIIVAPPGRSHWRAAEVAQRAAAAGRRVVAVTRAGDDEVARHADLVIPVAGEVPEEFTPLAYHGFAGYLGAAVADRLGRKPFGTG